jgi:hypothetical protein
MPKKRLTEAQNLKLLEDTKQRLRLQQEARTIARLEELEIEACEKLGRQLRLEHLELSGELECSETSAVRQYTPTKKTLQTKTLVRQLQSCLSLKLQTKSSSIFSLSKEQQPHYELSCPKRLYGLNIGGNRSQRCAS